jgi:serine/threonine protein kinase
MSERLESNLKLAEFIARGHFGEVHLGTDDIHGEVAIKVFRQVPDEEDANWQLRKSILLSEGQKLKQASHPNVVQVYHLVYSRANDAILLAMELCKGGSLQRCFEYGPLSLRSVRDHATQIVLGLQALHDRGMLHRDIKPGNILIDGNGTTKLGDFGLVTDDLVLGYGSVAGYIDHLPPEVHQGRATSVKSDIWALGMTVYRLLHGRTWYERSARPSTIIPHGGYADGLSWLPHIPKPWRRFVRTALHDDADRRYQNVGKVISALASLPVAPDWTCCVSVSDVAWQREVKGRVIRVNRIDHPMRRYAWKAWSEPLTTTGRSRTLEASAALLGSKEVDRALMKFFATHV